MTPKAQTQNQEEQKEGSLCYDRRPEVMFIMPKQRRRNRILSLNCSPNPAFTTTTLLIALFLFLGFPYGTPLSIKEQVLEAGLPSTGRRLLQAKKECPENFQTKNYTSLTSRCKGPNYPPKECCEAFKDFACPYASLLSDEGYNCPTRMFTYIDLYGNYPGGLFASECLEGKDGLTCSTPASATPSDHRPSLFSLILVVVMSLVSLWYLYFL